MCKYLGSFGSELSRLSCQECLLCWWCATRRAVCCHPPAASPGCCRISSPGCMGSSRLWAFRLEHRAVFLLLNVCYLSISLCLEQPHWWRHRAFEAQNKMVWKLLGRSMLLELYVDSFWRDSCIFWMEQEVWFAGLWGVYFVRHAFLKQFPDPQSRIKCGHSPNF